MALSNLVNLTGSPPSRRHPPESPEGEVQPGEDDLPVGDPGDAVDAAGVQRSERAEPAPVGRDLPQAAVGGAEGDPAPVGRELRVRATLGPRQGAGVELVEGRMSSAQPGPPCCAA